MVAESNSARVFFIRYIEFAYLLYKGAIEFADFGVVDAGFAALHESVCIKLPEFVSVGAVPLAGGVVPFVYKLHGDSVVGVGPERFL